MASAHVTVMEKGRRARPRSRSLMLHGFILAILVIYRGAHDRRRH